MNLLTPGRKLAWAFSLCAWSLGISTSFVMAPYVGGDAAALLAVPSGLAGWWLGTRRGGVLAAIALTVWQMTQFDLNQLHVQEALSSLLGMVAIIMVALLAGHTGTLHREFRATAKREGRMLDELCFHSVLLSSIGDGLVGIDVRRRVHHWNRAMTTMTGIGEADALGRPIDEVCPAIASVVGRGTTDDESHTDAAGDRAELRLTGSGDREVLVALNITPLNRWGPRSKTAIASSAQRRAVDRDQGHLCLVTDLSEHKALEHMERESLTRAMELQNAREAERLRRELVNAAAHELATPLTPLELQLDLLLSNRLEPLGDKQRAAVEVLQRNVRRLEGTIDRIMQAASEVHSTELGPKTEVPVPELLEGAIVAARETAHAKDIRFTVRTDAVASAVIRCDIEPLRRAIGNVMDEVLTGAPTEGDIWVDTRDRGAFIEITISDLGRTADPTGWSARMEQQVTHTNESGDLGLTLQVARKVIHAHHGHLHLSTARDGSSLHAAILLPRSTNSASDAEILFEGTQRAAATCRTPLPHHHKSTTSMAESPPEPLSPKHS